MRGTLLVSLGRAVKMFVPDRIKDARTSAWIMQRTPSPIEGKLTSGRPSRVARTACLNREERLFWSAKPICDSILTAPRYARWSCGREQSELFRSAIENKYTTAGDCQRCRRSGFASCWSRERKSNCCGRRGDFAYRGSDSSENNFQGQPQASL